MELLLLLVIAVGLFGIGVYLIRPVALATTRSISVDAAPAKLFAAVNDCGCWAVWVTWAERAARTELLEPTRPAGAGAGFAWFEDRKTGDGQVMLHESIPHRLVRLDLKVGEALEARYAISIELTREGDRTRMEWHVTRRRGGWGRAAWALRRLDQRLLRDIERALRRLRNVAESGQP